VDVWFEAFKVDLAEKPKAPPVKQPPMKNPAPTADAAGWQVFAPQHHPQAEALWHKLAAQGGAGAVVWLPEAPTEEHLELLLNGARAAMALKTEPHFVLVQHGWGGAAFARTLHLETPGLVTCILDVPPGHPQAVDWIAAEVQSATGFTEAHYDAQGVRREPKLKWLPSGAPEAPIASAKPGADSKEWPIGPEDILLVSGGGKGIGAECALALGGATGARLALVGRSEPAQDKELKENLERIAAAGVGCYYVCADVTDALAVRMAVAEAEKKLGGRVTALLHAAGANTPQLIGALDTATFKRTLAPKLHGVRNLLAAVEPERLRLFITFSSIIARVGLPGEADYGTANEWMTAFTEDFQARYPQCRCLALEWSVWSNIGMGERLGRMESLIQQGIMPIPPEVGVRILLDLVQRRVLPTALVVTGRFGEPPTLKFAQPELPLRRFLERRRVYYRSLPIRIWRTTWSKSRSSSWRFSASKPWPKWPWPSLNRRRRPLSKKSSWRGLSRCPMTGQQPSGWWRCAGPPIWLRFVCAPRKPSITLTIFARSAGSARPSSVRSNASAPPGFRPIPPSWIRCRISTAGFCFIGAGFAA
jgi:enediyne polyketide synthase